MRKTCETCRYLDAESSTCHRLPPVVVRDSPYLEPGADTQTYPEPESVFPSVRPGDWCGEHRLAGIIRPSNPRRARRDGTGFGDHYGPG